VGQYGNAVPSWSDLPTSGLDERNEIMAKLKTEEVKKLEKKQRDPYDVEYDRGKQKKVKEKKPKTISGQNVFQQLHNRHDQMKADPFERAKLGDKFGKRGKRKKKGEKYEQRLMKKQKL